MSIYKAYTIDGVWMKAREDKDGNVFVIPTSATIKEGASMYNETYSRRYTAEKEQTIKIRGVIDGVYSQGVQFFSIDALWIKELPSITSGNWYIDPSDCKNIVWGGKKALFINYINALHILLNRFSTRLEVA